MSTTPISTDSSTDSNWFEMGGRFLGYYATCALTLAYAFAALHLYTGDPTLSGLFDTLLISGFVLLISLLFAPIALAFDCYVFDTPLSTTLTIRGRDVSAAALWLVASAVPAVFWLLYKLIKTPDELLTAEPYVVAGVFYIVALGLGILPVLGTVALHRYWDGRYRPRLTVIVAAVVILAAILAGAAYAGGSEEPDPGIGASYTADATEPAVYDDGYRGPGYWAAKDDFIRADESRRSAQLLACSDSAGPVPKSELQYSSTSGYSPQTVHNNSTRIRIAPYLLNTDNETVQIEGHYHLVLQNSSAFNRQAIINSGIYDVEPVDPDESYIPALPGEGNGTVEMEQVEAMSVYYDVVTHDSEVHRYTARLCRDDGGEV